MSVVELWIGSVVCGCGMLKYSGFDKSWKCFVDYGKVKIVFKLLVSVLLARYLFILYQTP